MMQSGGIHAIQVVFLILLLFVVIFATLARKLQTPYPIVLVVAGLLLSFIPGIPRISFEVGCYRTGQCLGAPLFQSSDVGQAIDWLCEAFGFTLRLRIANHRAQLNVGDCAVVLTQQSVGRDPAQAAPLRSHRLAGPSSPIL